MPLKVLAQGLSFVPASTPPKGRRQSRDDERFSGRVTPVWMMKGSSLCSGGRVGLVGHYPLLHSRNLVFPTAISIWEALQMIVKDCRRALHCHRRLRVPLQSTKGMLRFLQEFSIQACSLGSGTGKVGTSSALPFADASQWVQPDQGFLALSSLHA